MLGDARVIEYLNRGLRHELTAINQYWLHYRMLDHWGVTRLGKKERKESIEEMHHADKLVDRILFLEGLPNLQHVAPLMIGQNVKEILECDLKGEHVARDTYTRAREVCRKNNITEQTFFRWRNKYGGMDVPDARRLKNLEGENARLKKLVAEQALAIDALKEFSRGK